MTPKQFRKYLDRDKACVHCGVDDDTLVPQHRIGRGMGGSKRLDTPSNIIVVCSRYNGLMESDPVTAAEARAKGHKLKSWEDSTLLPVWDVNTGLWWVLDDKFGRVPWTGTLRK